MTRPYLPETYDALCTGDLTWRIREISDLKKVTREADSIMKPVLLRALVTVCYAHWEGHVRFSANKYLEHVSMRRYKYSQLTDQFYLSYFSQRLRSLGDSGSSVAQRCEIVSEILTSRERLFSKPYFGLVDTRSNLSFAVVREICLVCGVDAGPFEQEASFIDKILLQRRNAIAHGEDAFVAESDTEEITQKTTELMRIFGNQLSNAAVLGSYKRT